MSDRAIEVLERIADTIERIDTINRRLITLLMITVITAGITATSIAYFYFCNENSVPQITQTQTASNNSNPAITIGKGDK